MKELLSEASFSFIRYGSCWEDADILLEGLSPAPGSRILSIASAGDNCLALLSKDPEILIAVDVSEVQLWLMELKMAAFRELEYEEMLSFLGVEAAMDRLS